MTTPIVGVSSIHPTRSYITNEFFKTQPTGLPVDALMPGITDPRQQDRVLAEIIRKSSSEMDQFCYGASGGVLYSTVDTEALWVRMDRFGQYKISPPFTPILAVTAFAAGSDAATLTAISDLSHATVERDKFRIQAFPFTGQSSAGPLQFGVNINPGYDSWVQYSYINGWPLTSVTGAVSAGATTITVGDATGIYKGSQLSLRDAPGGDEQVTVTAAPSGNTLTVSALQFTHSGGQQIDGLPEAITDACTEITVGLLKRRAQEGVKPTSKQHQALESPGEDNFTTGFGKLSGFVQVRWR